MHDNKEQPKLSYRGSVTSGPKSFVAKALSVVLGGAVLVGVFAVSMVFIAIALAVVLAAGGYVWWKTRDLRRQMREQMREHMQGGSAAQEPRQAHTQKDVIEGVVLSRKETNDQPRQ
jgi:uncharacterized protein HemX